MTGPIFFHGSVCLLYVGDTMPRVPRARGHVHVPFYEGTSQNLLRETGVTLEQLQSGITMVSDDRIDSIFCVTPWSIMCHVPHVHVGTYTCQNLLRATGGTLEQLQSEIMMASDDRND